MKEYQFYQPFHVTGFSDCLRNDFEASHHLFRDAFTKGFQWELLKVLSGPPHVTFTWRHWGKFTGKFQGNEGKGQVVNLYGMGRVTVDPETLKIGKIESFFDPDSLLKVMEGKMDSSDIADAQYLIGDLKKTAIEKMTESETSCCPWNKLTKWFDQKVAKNTLKIALSGITLLLLNKYLLKK